ncbi:MAG: ABC transporter ATP-binding protein [Chloroflexi bacterium]|nr:ABC transporter ATP-binding protein [Chloroflexota bacterium]MCL5275188.1 ABC transporter ATP-binding protein [Chloroflexota bacterium]
MIKAEGLSKSYGEVRALRDATFNVEEGEIVGLLGPNGAGKTTMIKILTGYLQPDEGEVEVDGIDVLTRPRDVQTRIGYLPENAPLYPELSVQDYLKMIAELREIPAERQLTDISEAVRATSLTEYLTRPIGKLSKGLRQRVGLAQAILHKPRLLILDEPTVGLDPTQIVEIRSLIRRMSRHSTILFSSHILPEVEALCDRVIIIMNGLIRADARLAELEATDNAVLVLQKKISNLESVLLQLPIIQRVEAVDLKNGSQSYRVYGRTGADICPALYDAARNNNWPLRELRRDARTLETVFNELATSELVAESEEDTTN